MDKKIRFLTEKCNSHKNGIIYFEIPVIFQKNIAVIDRDVADAI
jgi:hypothetical protein